jgi:hypothetical protein
LIAKSANQPTLKNNSARGSQLRQRFEALNAVEPGVRRLRDWLAYAEHQKIKHHSWIDGYAQTPATLEPAEQRSDERVQAELQAALSPAPAPAPRYEPALTDAPDAGGDDVGTASAPPKESIGDRNIRWLNHYEAEERTAKRGAYNRAAAHFGEESSKFRKAVDKARQVRTERNRSGLKAVPATASMFGGLVTTVRDGKKTTKSTR